MKQPSYIYIMGDRRPTLYVGVTSDLLSRVYQHGEKLIDGFTKDHNLTSLLYFEEFSSIEDAITREKQLKKWNRDWKLRLIKSTNPELKDLYLQLTDPRLREDDVVGVEWIEGENDV